MSLRNKLIRLAYSQPQLREDILPLVKSAKKVQVINRETGNTVSVNEETLKDPEKKKLYAPLKENAKKDKGGNKKEWKSKMDSLTSEVSKQDKKLKDTEKKLEDLEKKCKEMSEQKQSHRDTEEYWIGQIENHPVAKKLWKGKGGSGWNDLSDDEKKKVYAEKAEVPDLDENGKHKKENGKKKWKKVPLGELMSEASDNADKIQSEMWQFDQDVYDLRDSVDKEERKLKKLNKELEEHKEKEPEESEIKRTKSKEEKYKDAIKNSDMSAEDKKKAIDRLKDPKFDLDGALAGMGDDEEDGSKDASLRSSLIRLAYTQPQLRADILPLITKSAGKHYDRWEMWSKLLKRSDLIVEIERNPMPMYVTELKVFYSRHKQFHNVDTLMGDRYATIGYDRNGTEFTVHTGNKSSGYNVGDEKYALRDLVRYFK